jgi:tetratricopeptide (TPR) repeat protein
MVNEDAGYAEALIEALKKVIQLDPGETSEDRLKLVDNLVAIGDLAQARQHIAVLEKQAPDLLARHPLTSARMMLLEGNVQEAERIVQEALQQDPDSSEALLIRSQQLLSQNEISGAVEILERLLEIEPMSYQAHYRLGQAYARQGQRERAQQHLAMHQRILDLRVRIHSLERRAGRNPRDTEARSELIRSYEALGMTAQANFWRRAAARDR